MGWRDEILLDVQMTHPQLSAAQRRLLDIITKTATGGMIAWVGVVELSNELKRYRENKKGLPR